MTKEKERDSIIFLAISCR